MSKPKKKNSNYNYKQQKELEEKRKLEAKEKKQKDKKYLLVSLLGYLLLIVAVVCAIMKFTGDESFAHAENVYVTLSGLAIICICYGSYTLKKWVKSLFTILGFIEVGYGVFLIIQNAK